MNRTCEIWTGMGTDGAVACGKPAVEHLDNDNVGDTLAVCETHRRLLRPEPLSAEAWRRIAGGGTIGQ